MNEYIINKIIEWINEGRELCNNNLSYSNNEMLTKGYKIQMEVFDEMLELINEYKIFDTLNSKIRERIEMLKKKFRKTSDVYQQDILIDRIECWEMIRERINYEITDHLQIK